MTVEVTESSLPGLTAFEDLCISVSHTTISVSHTTIRYAGILTLGSSRNFLNSLLILTMRMEKEDGSDQSREGRRIDM